MTVVVVSTMFPWPSSVSVMTSSVLLSVWEEISFICQKISLRMAFLASSTVATSCGSSGAVVVFTAYTASTSGQTAREPDISSSS